MAGPVVAAAVILDPDNIPEGLNDSKQLSIARREELFDIILASSIVSIASSGAGRIDGTDIRKASLDAMRRAVAGLSQAPALVLADGRDIPPGLACMGKAVVKGDARSLSIAAASIIAKVARDRMMTRADLVFPAYGFATHAGYATPAPSQCHRRPRPLPAPSHEFQAIAAGRRRCIGRRVARLNTKLRCVGTTPPTPAFNPSVTDIKRHSRGFSCVRRVPGNKQPSGRVIESRITSTRDSRERFKPCFLG